MTVLIRLANQLTATRTGILVVFMGTWMSMSSLANAQTVNVPPNGQSALPQYTVEMPTDFAPPKSATPRIVDSQGIAIEVGNGLAPITPKFKLQGQIGNYVSPIQDRDSSQSPQNIDRSKLAQKKTQIETTQRVELIVENYDNGQPRLKRQVTQDLEGNYFNHGMWQLLGKRQEITAQGEFYLGRMNGEWKRLHNKTEGGLFATAPFNKFEGPFRSYAQFTDGQLDGVWKITDRYEQTIFEMPYSDGKRNGTATWYHTNGIKMREVSFKDGILDGPLHEWDMQEKITRQEEYQEGRKVVRETQFFRPKQPLSQNFYLDAKLELASEDNWWDAQPSTYRTVGQRIQHGPTGLWYQNGQPQMQGQFENGKREGIFIGWHPNGQKDVYGQFHQDLKTGKWTWWHTNGFKRVEGMFDEGNQIGEWIWWNEDGSVRNRRNMTAPKALSETSGTSKDDDETPSDSIQDDPRQNGGDAEEIEVQELPEKSNTEQSDGGNGDVPFDIIPLDADKLKENSNNESEGNEASEEEGGSKNGAEEIDSDPVEITTGNQAG